MNNFEIGINDAATDYEYQGSIELTNEMLGIYVRSGKTRGDNPITNEYVSGFKHFLNKKCEEKNVKFRF